MIDRRRETESNLGPVPLVLPLAVFEHREGEGSGIPGDVGTHPEKGIYREVEKRINSRLPLHPMESTSTSEDKILRLLRESEESTFTRVQGGLLTDIPVFRQPPAPCDPAIENYRLHKSVPEDIN